MTRREQLFIKAIKHQLDKGRMEPYEVIILIEDNTKYGWMSEEAKDVIRDYVENMTEDDEPKAPYAHIISVEYEDGYDPSNPAEDEPEESEEGEPEEEPAEEPQEDPEAEEQETEGHPAEEPQEDPAAEEQEPAEDNPAEEKQNGEESEGMNNDPASEEPDGN